MLLSLDYQKSQSNQINEFLQTQRQIYLGSTIFGFFFDDNLLKRDSDDERRKILKVVGPYDPKEQHLTNSKLHHPGTRVYFTEGDEFKDWLSSTDGCLWLYGGGK